MRSVLVFDPGESTGWMYEDDNILSGGTAGKDHREIAKLIRTLAPQVVVYESFKLYPGKAKSLSWNSFYPVEVIGVIKYICLDKNIEMVEQAPHVKKFAGGFDTAWESFKANVRVTEHTKDAYLHLRYYKRNKKERP